MSKLKDPKSAKPLPDEAGASAPDAMHSSDDLDLTGLEALREKLVNLQADDNGMDQSQVTSLQALVSFTAYDRGVNEDVVRTLVCKNFGVCDLSKIPSKNYEEVRRFLVDLNINEAMN